MRLHIITGDAEKAKNEAYALQRAEPDMDWMVLDASVPTNLFGYTNKRNVIWVRSGSGPLDLTTKHHVILPTTFSSVVTAHTATDIRRQTFVLIGLALEKDGIVGAWLDKSGVGYRPELLLEPEVRFVAEEV